MFPHDFYQFAPSNDLAASMAFYTPSALKQSQIYRRDAAACMVLEVEAIYVMLLTHRPSGGPFTKPALIPASTSAR